MNRISKQLLTLLALMGASASLVAYEFDFMNITEETIVLKFNTRSLGNVDRYAIVPPGGSVKFAVANADCYLRAAWAPFKKTDGWGNPIPYNGGLDLVTRTPDPKNPKRAIGRIEGKDSRGNDKQRLFGDQIAPAYAFYKMDVIMIPNELFDKTVAAAEKLCSGIDNAICQIINEVKDFSNAGMITNAAKGLGGGGSTPSTTPTPSSGITEPVSAVDEITPLITILEQVKQVITSSVDRAAGSANVSKIKALFTEDVKKKLCAEANMGLADFPSINAFYLNDGTKTKALGLIDAALAVLSSKTQLGLQGSIIRTSMDTDTDFSSLLSSSTPKPGSKMPTKKPENCEFGLAKIAGAAGEIAGISMCSARQFQINYATKKGAPDEMQFEGFSSVPKLQLVTGAGE